MNRAYEDGDAPLRAIDLQRDARSRERYESATANRILGLLPSGPTVLEMGFGAGGLVECLLEAGCTVEGIEPSPFLFRYVQARCGSRALLHEARLDDPSLVLDYSPYDAVVAMDVIEHLPNPRSLTGPAFLHLKPGGKLFIQTPNARSLRRWIQQESWEQLAPEEHLMIHSPNSLKRLLESEGFVVETLQTIGGTTTESLFRRVLRTFPSALLNSRKLGNALWAVARKKEKPE